MSQVHMAGGTVVPAPAAHSIQSLSAEEVQAFADVASRIGTNVGSVVLGKPEVVRLALAGLFAEGHLLIEDVPGVGKTTLARAIAASVRGQWRRIQFTPDLLPSDVSGVTIFNQANRQFEFHGGPVFANIVIADEINRASPKTQSALLEVMEERYVTVDGVRHPVPRPFLVVATQNPVEMDGTYRLPEAQLDRFLMKLTLGYPDEATEIEVLRGAAAGRSPDYLGAVTDTDTVAQLVRLAQRVYMADPLYAYAVRLATATREHKQVRIGVSPRGVIALSRAAQAYALTDGRAYVIPEDLKALIEPVFAHRLLLSPDASMRGVTSSEVLRGVVESVPVPSATTAIPARRGPEPANPPGMAGPQGMASPPGFPPSLAAPPGMAGPPSMAGPPGSSPGLTGTPGTSPGLTGTPGLPPGVVGQPAARD